MEREAGIASMTSALPNQNQLGRPMLLSVHMPKTGGTSFYKNLQDVYDARLLWHNNDWVEIMTPQAVERRERHRTDLIGELETFRRRFDAIHGHFSARKYSGLFRDARLVTFVRDPFQHAVSCYEFALRSDSLLHPGHDTFKARNMSVVELIEMYPDHQSMYVDGVPLEQFALIAISERYAESLALFERITGLRFPRHDTRENVNPVKPAGAYVISRDVRRAVERHRARDVELYRRAVERFERLRKANDL
jgi:hypothetical protein